VPIQGISNDEFSRLSAAQYGDIVVENRPHGRW